MRVSFLDISIAILVVVLVACVVLGVSYNAGYTKGFQQTMLYHETTGEYPNSEWRETHYDETLLTPDDILGSLRED